MPELRVASYNIHGCIGTDGVYNPERVLAVIHELDAHVIALQEVESNHQHKQLIDYLIKEKAWTYIEGPTLLRETGHYGNAILSSLPIYKHQLLDISIKNREPRGAIDLHMRYKGNHVRIIATHLGLLPMERRTQTRKLLAKIGNPEQVPACLTVLMGDLNEWFLWGRPLRWLRSWFGPTPAPATYPTRWPLLALDRILANPKDYLKRVYTHRTSLAKRASDHFPIVAKLEL